MCVMRRFFVHLMLIVMVIITCTASVGSGAYASVLPNVPGGLWFHARFENNYVPLINNKPDYSQFSYYPKSWSSHQNIPLPVPPNSEEELEIWKRPELYLVGDASRFKGVNGTLIVGTKSDDVLGQNTGIQRFMYNNETFDFGGGQIVSYRWDYPSISALTGTKVYWNLNMPALGSEDKVLMGGAIVPSDTKTAYDRAIVPYVKLETDSKDLITKINVYFVRSGDTLAAPVAPGPDVSAVRVSFSGNYARRYENWDGSGGYSSYGYGEYNGRESYSDNGGSVLKYEISKIPDDSPDDGDNKARAYYYGLNEVTVEVDKGYDTYRWTFCPADREFRNVDWGEYLSNSTIKIVSGDTIDVFVQGLPDTYPSVDISVWNPSIASVDNVEFNVQPGTYSDDVYIGNKSTLSFVFSGLKYGITRLDINFHVPVQVPDNPDDVPVPTPIGISKSCYIIVTDEDGNLPEPENEPDFKAHVNKCNIVADFVEGRPYYPSARNNYSNFTLRKEISGDINDEIAGAYCAIYSGDEVISYTLGAWIEYEDGKNYITFGSLGFGNNYDLENLNLWVDFPNSSDLSGVIHGISIDKTTYRDKDEQLKTYVPYFELIRSGDIISRIDWRFVNPSNQSKAVEPENVPNVYIDMYMYGREYIPLDDIALSGSFDLLSEGITYNEIYRVVFRFNDNGTSYHWEFYWYNPDCFVSDWGQMGDDTYGTYQLFTETPVSIDLAYGYAYADEIRVWDDSIVSVEPAVFDDTTSRFAFTLKGLKAGETTISFIAHNPENVYSDGTQQYYATQRKIRVIEGTMPDVDPDPDVVIESSDLEVSYEDNPAVIIPLIEGRPNYKNSGFESRRITLTRENINWDGDWETLREKLRGTLYAYVSGDPEPYETRELYPTDLYNYFSENTHRMMWRVRYYCELYRTPNQDVHIEWKFTDSLINDGSYDIQASKAKTPQEQLDTRKPYVELSMNGLNVTEIRYGFVDSSDNKITPDVTSVDIQVFGRADYYGSSLLASASGTNGTIELEYPASGIENIYVYFEEDGITYRWRFDNDRAWNSDSEYVRSWGGLVTDDYLPLVMKAGEVKDINIILNRNYGTPMPFVGNTSIVSMDVLNTTYSNVSIMLTALKAGMTTFTLSYGYSSTYAREIWVADDKGGVPGLTDDVDAFINELRAMVSQDRNGSKGDEYESPYPAPEPEPTPEYDEESKDVGVEGLSVYPRFAMPDYTSDMANEAISNYMYNLNLGDVEEFVDGIYYDITTSVDAVQAFNKLSADLINMDTPQLLAVVLPEFEVNYAGFYMFRVPIENVTNPGTSIFFVSGEIAKEDAEIVNVSAVPMPETEVEDTLKNDRMLFVDDDGFPCSVISGDEYINVVAYFGEGTYSPIITAEATQKDVELILAKIRPVQPTPTPTPTPTPAPNDDDDDNVQPNPNPTPSDDVKPTPSDDIRPTPSDDVRPTPSDDVRPTPSDDVRPTPSDDIRPTPTPSDDVRPTPTPSDDVRPTPTPNDDVRPTPTPSDDVRPTPTPSDDVRPTPTPSDDVQPTPTSGRNVKPDTTPLNLDSIGSRIIGLLGLSSGTEVLELPESSYGSQRDVSDLSDEDRSAIPSNETVVGVLPIIVVTRQGVYVFAVTLSNAEAGTNIVLHMMSENTSASANVFDSASDTEDAYKFLDDDGNEITTVPANKHINIAAYMEPGKTYAPVITTVASSPSPTPSPTPDNNNNSAPGSSGGGGCDSGFSIYVLALMGLSLISKRRK